MRALRLTLLFSLLLSVRAWSAEADAYWDIDWYPLFELNRAGLVGSQGRIELRAARLSVLLGLIELVRRPEWMKARVFPVTYQRGKNQHHLSPILLSTVVHKYYARTGLPVVLGTFRADFSNATLLSWRTKHDDPYLSGGVSALFGQILGNYAFVDQEGNRFRACKLTEALCYSRNENGDKTVNSLWGWVFAADWNSEEERSGWRFSLLKRCFSVGRTDGKTYGRVLWIPIGDAPPFFRNLLGPSKGEKPTKPKTDPKPTRMSL